MWSVALRYPWRWRWAYGTCVCMAGCVTVETERCSPPPPHIRYTWNYYYNTNSTVSTLSPHADQSRQTTGLNYFSVTTDPRLTQKKSEISFWGVVSVTPPLTHCLFSPIGYGIGGWLDISHKQQKREGGETGFCSACSGSLTGQCDLTNIERVK